MLGDNKQLEKAQDFCSNRQRTSKFSDQHESRETYSSPQGILPAKSWCWLLTRAMYVGCGRHETFFANPAPNPLNASASWHIPLPLLFLGCVSAVYATAKSKRNVLCP